MVTKTKIAFNPVTGKFDLITDLTDIQNELDLSQEIIFENKDIQAAESLAENPPITKNYFMSTNLDNDDRYVMVHGGNSFTFLDCRNPYGIEIILDVNFNNAPGAFGQPQAATSIGDYIYVCASNGKIHTLDWSDRENPVIAAEVSISSGQHYDLASNGVDTLFIANVSNNQFIAVDASNPLALSLINTVSLGGFGSGVTYYDGYAHCTNFQANQIHTFEFGAGTWNQIDITPSVPNPSRLSVVETPENEVVLIANRYNNSTWGYHDLSTPSNLGAVNSFVAPATVNIYSRAHMVDGFLYHGMANGELLVMDFRDINNIELHGTFQPLTNDGLQQYASVLSTINISNQGLLTGDTTYIVTTGNNLQGGVNPSNRDVRVLELPLIKPKDNTILLESSKTITGANPYYEIVTDGITVSLPPNPNDSDKINITNFSIGSATIDGNGNDIMGLTSQTIYKDESLNLIFNETEWKVI